MILGETLQVLASSQTTIHVQPRNAEARDYPCQILIDLGNLSRGTTKTVVFLDQGSRVEIKEGRIL